MAPAANAAQQIGLRRGRMASKSNSTLRKHARSNGRCEWSSPRNTQAASRSGEARPSYSQDSQTQGTYSNYLPDYEAEAERRRSYAAGTTGLVHNTLPQV